MLRRERLKLGRQALDSSLAQTIDRDKYPPWPTVPR